MDTPESVAVGVLLGLTVRVRLGTVSLRLGTISLGLGTIGLGTIRLSTVASVSLSISARLLVSCGCGDNDLLTRLLQDGHVLTVHLLLLHALTSGSADNGNEDEKDDEAEDPPSKLDPSVAAALSIREIVASIAVLVSRVVSDIEATHNSLIL